MFDYVYLGFQNNLHLKENMALELYSPHYSALNKVATVRFFSLPKDSVVLGYGQATDVIKKFDGTFEPDRRITGGSHVHLGNNIFCYSFSIPRDGSFRTYEDMRRYYAGIVADSLEDLGIENIDVDNKASTINIDGRMVASHAIWWGVESALMHGILHIEPSDVDKIAARLYLAERVIGNKVYTEYSALKNIPVISKQLPNIASSLDGEERTYALEKIISDAILRRLGNLTTKMIDETVMAKSVELYKERFGASSWFEKRLPPFTKEEVEEIPGEELNGKLKKNLGYCTYIQVSDKDFKKMTEPF